MISDGKKSSTHKYVKISSSKKRRAQMHFQLTAILVIYRLLFENLMVTRNQKYTIDTHTHKKKESKHNTKVSLAGNQS